MNAILSTCFLKCKMKVVIGRNSASRSISLLDVIKLYSIGYPQYKYKINVYNGIQNIYSISFEKVVSCMIIYKETQYILYAKLSYKSISLRNSFSNDCLQLFMMHIDLSKDRVFRICIRLHMKMWTIIKIKHNTHPLTRDLRK